LLAKLFHQKAVLPKRYAGQKRKENKIQVTTHRVNRWLIRAKGWKR